MADPADHMEILKYRQIRQNRESSYSLDYDHFIPKLGFTNDVKLASPVCGSGGKNIFMVSCHRKEVIIISDNQFVYQQGSYRTRPPAT